MSTEQPQTKKNDLSELELSDELYARFSEFIYLQSGITLKKNKKTLLRNRLSKRLRVLSLDNFEEYWNYLQNSLAGKKELTHFFEVVSTNETFFQRGTDHYDVLSKHIIPNLLKNNNPHIKIWSAGCSSGEEPYDICMVMNDLKDIFPRLSFSILATDLSQEELTKAQRGEYGDHSIQKLTPYQRNKYFEEVIPEQSNFPFSKEVLQVKPFLKNNIEFRQHNLVTDKYPQKFDVIFCRNVMIYFDQKVQVKILQGFYNALIPYSFLFIGHSESLQVLNSPFEFKRFPEGSVYIRKDGNYVP